MEAAYLEAPVKTMNRSHSMDRKLYSILVFELERDPKVSVNIIALWVWLEQGLFNDVVPKILLLPIKLINGLADEAVACLRCITDTMYLFSSDASEISLTQNLLGKQLSLNFFHENRVKASCGIRMVVENVCVKVLKDLIEMAIKRKTERQLLRTQMVRMPPSVAEPMDSMIPRFGGLRLTGESSQSAVLPMDPMMERFGGLRLTGESSQSVVPPLRMENPKDNRTMVPPSRMENPKHNRTMFATFSKGYPVSERELRDYFNRMFGDCVESISMQLVKPNEQSLFALIVFTSPAIVYLILRGMEKAKFMVKGKQVWMRKYIPKV